MGPNRASVPVTNQFRVIFNQDSSLCTKTRGCRTEIESFGRRRGAYPAPPCFSVSQKIWFRRIDRATGRVVLNSELWTLHTETIYTEIQHHSPKLLNPMTKCQGPHHDLDDFTTFTNLRLVIDLDTPFCTVNLDTHSCTVNLGTYFCTVNLDTHFCTVNLYTHFCTVNLDTHFCTVNLDTHFCTVNKVFCINYKSWIRESGEVTSREVVQVVMWS
jgi:hypothetical protein